MRLVVLLITILITLNSHAEDATSAAVLQSADSPSSIPHSNTQPHYSNGMSTGAANTSQRAEPQVTNQKISDRSPRAWQPIGLDFYRAVGVLYSGASALESSSIKITSGGQQVLTNESLKFEPEITFSAEVGVRSEGFSWSFGFEYDLERASYSLQGASVQIINLNANIMYFTGNKYLKGGVNYSLISLESGDNNISTSANPGVGMQLGIGMFLDQNVAIEFGYRKITFTAKAEAPANEKIDFGTLKAEGIQAGFKYFF